MKTFEMKTVIHFGDNALDRLAELPYKKVLVITDPFIAKGKMIELITDPLRRGRKNRRRCKEVPGVSAGGCSSCRRWLCN